jgi:hypothetical protein
MSAGDAANTFFDLPAEILSGPGRAMFVHNLLRCWVDTHQRSSQSLTALGTRQGPADHPARFCRAAGRTTGLLAASLPLLPRIGSSISRCPSTRFRPFFAGAGARFSS